jgi:hypothetical protein
LYGDDVGVQYAKEASEEEERGNYRMVQMTFKNTRRQE